MIFVYNNIASESKLSGLNISSGTLSPEFSSTTLTYNLNVSTDQDSITITPASLDGTSSISVQSVSVNSGSSSGPVALAFGNNTINVTVVAQDNVTVSTYTIYVYRPYCKQNN